MTKQQTEREEACECLRNILKPGDTVYTILRHHSASGMSHVIDAVVFRGDQPCHLGYNAAKAISARYDTDRDGVKFGGCGMDFGFDLVYRLGMALWPEGFECVGRDARCPSNDHANGDRDYEPHHHASGGYALQHKWL